MSSQIHNHSKRLDELVKKIRLKDRRHVLSIIKSENQRIWHAPGGLYKHQYWRGGYIDHIIETMSFACILYKALNVR